MTYHDRTIEPSLIIWFKNGKYRKASKTFHTIDEINEYYAKMRNRIAVLMCVVKVKNLKNCDPEVLKDLGISINNAKLTPFLAKGV